MWGILTFEPFPLSERDFLRKVPMRVFFVKTTFARFATEDLTRHEIVYPFAMVGREAEVGGEGSDSRENLASTKSNKR